MAPHPVHPAHRRGDRVPRPILAGGLGITLLLSAAAVATGPAAASAPPAPPQAEIAPPPPVSGPFVEGNKTVRKYDYSKAIRESVRVDTKIDSDGDGKNDVIAMDIVRPSEAARDNVKIPVIIDPSPYYACCGRGGDSEKKQYGSNGVHTHMPQFYDNYFVEHGYAVAALDLIGTSRSTGCGDIGGKDDVASATLVVDWLNGRNTASHVGGGAAKADWSTGSVGMLGKSYDGTVPNGAAATGVPGLKTVVPIVGISSWYTYTRYAGMVLKKDYMTYLGKFVGNNNGTCTRRFNRLDQQAGDNTGNYNAIWAERDHVKDAAKVKASVFVVHGQEDMNVMPINFSAWWQALAENDVPRKIWLARSDHADPFDYRRTEWVKQLHEWFDHWLMGLDNGVMDKPLSDVEFENETWQQDASWPVAKNVPVGLARNGLDGSGAAGSGNVTIKEQTVSNEDQVSGKPTGEQAYRKVFLSAPVAKDVRVSGHPSVTLTIKSNKAQTPLVARLVDYGNRKAFAGIGKGSGEDCFGGKIATDDGCYQPRPATTRNASYAVFGRGWQSAEHRLSLSNPTPLKVGEWTEVTIPIMGTDQLIRAGHQIGLSLLLSDHVKMDGRSRGATVDIDLARSRLNLPTNQADAIKPATALTVPMTYGPPPILPPTRTLLP